MGWIPYTYIHAYTPMLIRLQWFSQLDEIHQQKGAK